MIADAFMFNDEFDMLDLRLELSKNYVDRWIILEGNRTWSGKLKPYHFSQQLDAYQHKYGNKFHVISLDIPADYRDWQCENFSRANLQQGINLLDSDDIVIHSDLDEILNPDALDKIIAQVNTANQPVCCTLDMFIYRFDQQAHRTWQGHVIAKKHMFRDPQQLYKGNQHKRKNRAHCAIFPGIAGWHWTWMGDDTRIQSKVISNIESQYRDPDQVLESFKTGNPDLAINHKCKTTCVNYQYPESVLGIIKQYPWWTDQANFGPLVHPSGSLPVQ
jgi:beta-1,4-mannosyl-glycoprotein beta-1,4-N-acetylglucosaminyltransferase